MKEFFMAIVVPSLLIFHLSVMLYNFWVWTNDPWAVAMLGVIYLALWVGAIAGIASEC